MKTRRIPLRNAAFLLALAVLLALAPWMGGSAQAASAKVFSLADIETATVDLKTVDDYVKAVNPVSYSWVTIDVTGLTHISMEGEHGSVTVTVDLEGKGIGGRDSYENYKKALPARVRKLAAEVDGATWENGSFAIPTPRGVQVGASKSAVLKAYKNLNGKNGVLYSGKSINSKAQASWWADNFIGGHIIDEEGVTVIEYVNCSPFSGPSEDEWREYYTLRYYLDGKNKVSRIAYSYFTDPE